MTILLTALFALALFILVFKPSRIELKPCSSWTLWPWVTRTESTHKTKHFWLVHLVFCDVWIHFEETRK